MDVKDSNGSILDNGDSVQVIKDLKDRNEGSSLPSCMNHPQKTKGQVSHLAKNKSWNGVRHDSLPQLEDEN